MLLNLKAIMFGSIGTIVETSELQRKSFNKAFSEAGKNVVNLKRN